MLDDDAAAAASVVEVIRAAGGREWLQPHVKATMASAMAVKPRITFIGFATADRPTCQKWGSPAGRVGTSVHVPDQLRHRHAHIRWLGARVRRIGSSWSTPTPTSTRCGAYRSAPLL